jgi:hypothetical protein
MNLIELLFAYRSTLMSDGVIEADRFIQRCCEIDPSHFSGCFDPDGNFIDADKSKLKFNQNGLAE